jgi:hypothetical protein
MLSGIGDADRLRAAGVEPRHDLVGVGVKGGRRLGDAADHPRPYPRADRHDRRTRRRPHPSAQPPARTTPHRDRLTAPPPTETSPPHKRPSPGRNLMCVRAAGRQPARHGDRLPASTWMIPRKRMFPDRHQAGSGADSLRNSARSSLCGIRPDQASPEKRETPGSTRESGGFGERRISDVVVELELMRMRTEPHRINVIALQLDPGLDEVGGEDISGEQIVMICFQVVEDTVQAIRNRMH